MINRLAIMDYGVGGLDLYKRIKQYSPQTGITYFSDSGEVPYGKLSKKVLHQRVAKVIAFLRKEKCKTVIVACHSASSVAQHIKDGDVITMIEYTRNCLPEEENPKVGIIGGGRTIKSGIYSHYYRSQGFVVEQRIAQSLSILIERGETDSEEVTRAIDKILKPLRDVDFLILACTHYPVLRKPISIYLGDKCKVVDPMNYMFDDLKASLPNFDKGSDIFYTSGGGFRMKEVAQKVYDINIPDVKELDMNFDQR